MTSGGKAFFMLLKPVKAEIYSRESINQNKKNSTAEIRNHAFWITIALLSLLYIKPLSPPKTETKRST